MIRSMPSSIRLLPLATIAIALAATLIVAAPRPAHAHQPGWSNGYGKAYGHHRHHRRWRAHRHHHRHAHRRWRQQRYYSNSGSGFLDNISAGNIIGGLLGAAAGTQFGKGNGRTVAVLGGAILGAVLGGKVEQSIRDSDRRQANATLERSPTGQTVSWRNPGTGASYNVTPTRTYQTSTGRVCRDYTTWVFIDGYEEQARGTACRQPDGTWTTSAN